MDEKKIRQILFGLGPTNVTESAQGEFSGPQRQPTSAELSQKNQAEFAQRNMQGGVAMETTEEVPFGVRFGAAMRPTDDDRLAFLNSYYRTQYPYFYKEPPARLSDTGEIVVRLPTPEGSKDVMLNARGMTAEDFGVIGAYAPEIAGSALAVLAGRKIPSGLLKRFPKTTATGASAGGAAGAGVAKDVAVRAADDQPPQLMEIAKRRGTGALLDIAFDAGIASALGVGRKILSVPRQRDMVDQELAEAVDYFKATHGIDFPLTAGELTGSPLFKRTEAMMERLPGSSKTMQGVRGEQRDVEGVIQEKLLGEKRAAIPSEDVVGRDAVAALESKVAPLVEGVAQKRLRVVELANRRVLDLMDQSQGVQKQVYPERVGGGIRARVVAEYDTLQEQAALRYGALESLPGGSDRVLTAPTLSKKANDLINRLASVEVTKDVPTGILDSRGRPISTQQQVVERLKEFLPEGVEALLTRLSNLDDTSRFSLRDLLRARNAIDNKITKESANIPSTRLKELGEIRKLMDDGVNEAVDSVPDKRLRDMYKDTNKWYKENRSRFDDVTLQKLFHEFNKSGGIRDEDIVRNIGLSEYQVFKKFLGDKSPEFLALRRSIADAVVESSTTPGGMIEGKALIKELSELYKNKRSIAEDVFGRKGGPLASQLQQLGELLNNAETKIDAQRFRSLLSGDKPLAMGVRELAAADTKLNRAYRSDILKKIGDGSLASTDLDAGKFMDLVFGAAGPKEIAAVVDQLKDRPDILMRLRQKTIERLFFNAQRHMRATDPARIGPGELFRSPSSSKLESAIGRDVDREKMRVLLGNDTMEDVIQFGKLIRAREASEQTFQAAGGLAAGAAVASMIRHGPISYMADWAKQRFAVAMLTWPGLKRVARMRSGDFDDVAIGLIATEPYFRHALESSGVNMEDFANEIQKGTEKHQEAQDAKVLRILGPPPTTPATATNR